MLLLAVLVFGLFAGWVAQLLLGTRAGRVDWTEALIAGLVGSFVGGTVASVLAGDGLAIRPAGLLGSIAGAVAVSGIWLWVAERGSR